MPRTHARTRMTLHVSTVLRPVLLSKAHAEMNTPRNLEEKLPTPRGPFDLRSSPARLASNVTLSTSSIKTPQTLVYNYDYKTTIIKPYVTTSQLQRPRSTRTIDAHGSSSSGHSSFSIDLRHFSIVFFSDS